MMLLFVSRVFILLERWLSFGDNSLTLSVLFFIIFSFIAGIIIGYFCGTIEGEDTVN